MKKVYVKPMLNESMNGTLEGVYACCDDDCGSNKKGGCKPCDDPCKPSYSCGSNLGCDDWWKDLVGWLWGRH